MESSSPTLERRYPAVRLLRGIGLAVDARKILLAALGLILSWAGWYAMERFTGDRVGDASPVIPLLGGVGDSFWNLGPRGLVSSVTEPYVVVIAPFLRVFSINQGPIAFLQSLAAAVWGVIVWGIIGGAIARITAVQTATGTRIGMLSAIRFAFSRALALVGAPLCPMIGIGFFAALCAPLGLLYQVPGAMGETIAGVLAFLPLLAGLVMAMILLGVAVGWPLMIATVAVEAQDAFDGLSRSYSYVFNRPLNYAIYTLLSLLIGILGLVFVTLFAALVVQMALWGLSFGGPDERILTLFAGEKSGTDLAVSIHGFWVFVVRILVHGWIYSYFFSSATMIYLLLRRDVDGAVLEDVGGLESEAEPFARGPVKEPSSALD